MPPLTRSKALIVFVVFAGLVLAGVLILTMQEPAGPIPMTPEPNEGLEDVDGPTAHVVPDDPETKDPASQDGNGGSGQRIEGKTKVELEGPPALFPTKDIRTREGFYLAFSELCRKSPEEFEKRAHQAFDGQYPLAAKMAALASWYDWMKEDRLGPYKKLFAIRHRKGEPRDTTTVRMQTFAVQHLGESAYKADAGPARSALMDYLETRTVDVANRAQCYTAILRWGQADEVRRCIPVVRAERDHTCIQAIAEALSSSTEDGAAKTLRDLATNHPSAAARERFKEILAKD